MLYADLGFEFAPDPAPCRYSKCTVQPTGGGGPAPLPEMIESTVYLQRVLWTCRVKIQTHNSTVHVPTRVLSLKLCVVLAWKCCPFPNTSLKQRAQEPARSHTGVMRPEAILVFWLDLAVPRKWLISSLPWGFPSIAMNFLSPCSRSATALFCHCCGAVLGDAAQDNKILWPEQERSFTRDF